MFQETLLSFTYNEIISTRLLISGERGRQFLDLKCGNLMVQKITRIETQLVSTCLLISRKLKDWDYNCKDEAQNILKSNIHWNWHNFYFCFRVGISQTLSTCISNFTTMKKWSTNTTRNIMRNYKLNDRFQSVANFSNLIKRKEYGYILAGPHLCLWPRSHIQASFANANACLFNE